MMPSLLRDSARNSSDARTRRGSTVRGIAMPCLAPIILIHMHRALWMWAAIMRTVRRGTPGTAFDHIAGGRFSMRYIVTRLFVRQAAIRERPVSRSGGTFVHSGSGALTPSSLVHYPRACRQGAELRLDEVLGRIVDLDDVLWSEGNFRALAEVEVVSRIE